MTSPDENTATEKNNKESFLLKIDKQFLKENSTR